MNRLYTVLNALLVLGGLVALVSGVWAFGALLLLLGGAGLTMEIRARKSSVHVVLANGPDAGLERAKAQGLQNTQVAETSIWVSGF